VTAVAVAGLGDLAGMRDPRGLRGDAPLLDAWLRATAAAAQGAFTPMTIPGHKQCQELTGAAVAGDIPLYGGLAAIKHADVLVADAERRAARLWGADWCRLSVAGSTHGNQALALAAGSPGDEVIISRTLHRSLMLGLVLAGLRPVWVRPELDPASGLPLAVAVETVRAAHPRACAVFLGDPSYAGTTGDLAGQAEAAHEAGVPLIVDAAWGAHLGFHPDLPPHALAAGADAMVTSAHKMLPAYSQGALVLARTDRLDAARLDRAFAATHTTSPAGAILASIDAARALLARDGEQLCARLLAAVTAARDRLRAVPGLRVLDGQQVDPAKLVVLLAGRAPRTVLPPREAFFAPHETVPADLADGRISAELIAPHPPGIPVLAPGELVTAEIISALRAVLEDGGRIAYAADPTLATLQVLTMNQHQVSPGGGRASTGDQPGSRADSRRAPGP
jgi:lysine decarboxylase